MSTKKLISILFKLNKLCRIQILNVTPEDFMKFQSRANPVAHGLLSYEGMPCQMNCLITPQKDCLNKFITNKEYLVQVGYRIFRVPIIFSEECYMNKKLVIIMLCFVLTHFLL